MEHRLLEYFMAVCEELHFTRAAEKLGISQPTLSHQIQLLEHRVGAPLFHRIGKKTYISEAGHILFKHCLTVFHELEQAQREIDEWRGMQRGRLRIGCSGNHLLTDTIAAFHRQYPGIELSVIELATDETKEGLLANTLDIGVVFLPLEDDELVNIELFNEELQWVVSSRHECFEADFIALNDLRRYPVLLLQKKFLVRQLIDRYCEAAGFTLRPILELSTLESLLQMAAQHTGGAILPRSYVDTIRDERLRALPIIEPVPQNKVGLVYRKGTFMCASMETFIRQLVGRFKPLEEDSSLKG